MSKEKIWAEIDIIYEGPEGRIYVPKTETASMFLGQGTRWCTASVRNNVFDYYSQQGPLYIFVLPEKDKNGREIKYQLHLKTEQFMDSEDQKININSFSEFDLLNKLFDNFSDESKILKIIQNNLFFDLFSNNEFYKDIFREILIEKLKFSKDFSFLEKVDCQEICQMAAEYDIRTLSVIPGKFVTQKLCEMALMSNGYKNGLHYIPKKFKTFDLCKIAVEQNPLFLEFVPENFKTQEICENAIKENGVAFSYTHQKFQTKELLEYAIKNGLKLHNVPGHMRTLEVCKIAVQHDEIALLSVPYYLVTEELYEIAVKNNKHAIRYVPSEFKTQELCEIAVKQYGGNLQYINGFRTQELCRIAVEDHPPALNFVPDEFKTQELCEIAVRNNGYAICKVPENFRTKKMCELAIEQKPESLIYVPYKKEFLNRALFLILEKNGLNYSFEETIEMIFSLGNNPVKPLFESLKEEFEDIYLQNQIKRLILLKSEKIYPNFSNVS